MKQHNRVCAEIDLDDRMVVAGPLPRRRGVTKRQQDHRRLREERIAVDFADPFAERGVAHRDQFPRLAVAGGGGALRGFGDAAERRFRHRIGLVGANAPAGFQYFVEFHDGAVLLHDGAVLL